MNKTIIPNWVTYGILFIAAFFFVFLFSCTTSPLYEHYPFWFHGDSGIFQEMGVCLLQGGTPYVDLFDHKGPVLWFIQAFGLWISHKWGLMAVQSLFLFFTMILWYRSSLIIVGKQMTSLFVSVLGLFFLLAFYERGNLCEEWCLPFITLPIYIYLKRSKENESPKYPIYNHTDTFIMGLCVGIIAMIRLNNTAPIIGFVLWHFIRCLKQNEYKRFLTDVVLICSGMISVIVSCALFYLIKAGWNGVYEMIYGTFIFNILYSTSAGASYSFNIIIQYYFPLICFLIISVYICLKNKTLLNITLPLIISYIVTIITIGRFCYHHYLMTYIPLYILTTLLVFKSSFKILYVVLLAIIILLFSFSYSALDCLLFRMTKEPPNTERHNSFHNFVTSKPENERKSIYNDGLNHIGHGMFANENITQCNRIISKNHCGFSPRLREYQSNHGIKDLKPVWVLTQSPRPEASDAYMATHYTLADSIPGGEFDPIWCWKKIDEHELLESTE